VFFSEHSVGVTASKEVVATLLWAQRRIPQ